MSFKVMMPDYIKTMEPAVLHAYAAKLTEERMAAYARLDQWDYTTLENAIIYTLKNPTKAISKVAARDIIVLIEGVKAFDPMLKKWPRDRLMEIAADTPEKRFALHKIIKDVPDEETYINIFGGAVPASRVLQDEFFVWYKSSSTQE